jgi:hypothetical protein
MKLLRTALGSFLTGSEIADAVLTYGLALARQGAMDTVDIPYVVDGGASRRAQFAVGRAADVQVLEAPNEGPELEDPITTVSLYTKSAAYAERGSSFAWDELAEMNLREEY